MRADYTFTLSEDNTTHRQLLRRPKNKLSLSSSWQITDSLSITGGLLYVGSWMDNDPETYLSHQTNGYTTLNLASTYRISPSLSIFTRIDNLLNRHYQNPLGYLQPGLGAYGGIKISY